MALPKDSISTWGWKQNSLVSVADGDYTFTPEFYLIKHFSAFVKEGAVMLSTEGDGSSCVTAFENPDGSCVAVVMNPFDFEKTLTLNGKSYALAPRSFHTILL